MPITKKRPHIIELLDIAVEQRRKLQDTKIEILERPALIWYQSYGNEDSVKTIFKQGSLFYKYSNYLWIKLIILSRYCEKLLTDKYAGYARLIIWPLALAILTYEAQKPSTNDNNVTMESTVFATLDTVINCWFIVDAMIRLIGTVIRIKIEKAFGREMKYFEIFQGCGFIDLIVSSFNFGLGVTTAGLWIRLFRLVLITNAVLDKIPHISVLFSGISNGLRSILFTIILLFLEMAVWASFGNYFFKDNDPFYFGTYGLSLLSYFQITTFESWNDIYNVNAYGCDKFPGIVYGTPKVNATLSDLTIDTGYGVFYYPACSKPLGQPITSSVLFVTYVLVGSYIMISMNLAAVSIGINEKLLSLRTLQLYGDNEASSRIAVNAVPRRLNKSTTSSSSKINKLLGNKDDSRYYTMMLQNLWSGKTSVDKRFGSNDLDEFSLRRLSWVRLQAMSKRILKFKSYQLLIFVLIVIDICIQMQDQTYGQDESSRIVHLIFNVLFLLDNCLYMLSDVMNWKAYVRSPNMFDFLITIIVFIPTCNPGVKLIEFLGAFRVLRLVRLSRIFSLAISDLMVILQAVQSSFLSVLYVVALLVLLLIYFAIAGILLFDESTPYFFGNIGVAMKTLLQVMTMDSWTDVMRRNMLGCKVYTTLSPSTFYDSQCTGDGKGLGWLAAFYFILFVVVFSMVLISLLVGVIIASMELLKEGLNEENEIWDNVYRVKKTYQLEESSIEKLLELFEKMDVECNGCLSFEQIQILLKYTDLSPEEQFDFFMLMDRDKSGLIDFAEFCELVELMGIRYRQKNPTLIKGKNKKRDAAILKNFPSVREVGTKSTKETSIKSVRMAAPNNDVSVVTEPLSESQSPNQNGDSSMQISNGSKKHKRKNAVVPIAVSSIDDEIDSIETIETLDTIGMNTAAETFTTNNNDIESNFSELKEDRFTEYHRKKDIGHNGHNGHIGHKGNRNTKVFLPKNKNNGDEEKSFHSRIEALFHTNHDNIYHADF